MTMAAPAAATPTSFRLRLPTGWLELDLDRRTSESSIDRLLREQVRLDPELRDQRAGLRRLLREAVRDARAAGAAFVACLPPRAEQDLLAGTVMVSLLTRASDAGPPTVDELSGQLTPEPRREASETWQEVSLTTLADGRPAVRSAGVQDIALEQPAATGERTLRTVLQQTLVPVPEGLLAVSCSSPQVAIADAWLELFDALTGTLEVTGAPTHHKEA